MTHAHALALTALLIVTSAACGSKDTASSADRAVDVEMRENAFDPAILPVTRGEEIEFTFHNVDKVKHEAFFGTAKEQAKHEEAMVTGDEHEMHGTKSVTVEPGKSESIAYTVGDGESLVIGCHEPGHYAAGMIISVPVT